MALYKTNGNHSAGLQHKVLITGPVDKELLEEFTKVADIHVWEGRKEFLMPDKYLYSIVSNYDAIINFADVSVNKKLIIKASRLKIIANASAGFDNLDLQLLTKHKIWASNVPGVFSFPVAEYVLACILTLLRRLFEADQFVRNNEWKTFEPGRWDGASLKEKTLGIIGLGSIGKELRKMALCLGATVIYFDPIIRKNKGWVPLELLTEQSDIISIHIPLNTNTFRLFNKKTIFNIKAGAILVNTSRGAIIEEAALIEALQTGRLGGAVLDVFEQEPDVPDVFKEMRNVILTPHIAGGTQTSRKDSIRRAFKNVSEVLTGSLPVNPLNMIQ